MQDGALVADRDRQIISGATGKDSEHGISSRGYKTRKRKKGMTILNNPECPSRPLGDECGNTDKVNSGGVGGGRKQQRDHDRR